MTPGTAAMHMKSNIESYPGHQHAWLHSLACIYCGQGWGAACSMMGPGGRAATDRAKRTEWLALVYAHDDGWDIRHDECPRRSRGRSSCRMSRYFIYLPILLPPGNFSMRRNTVPGTTFLYRRVRSDGTEQNTSLLKTKQIMRDDIEVQFYIFVPAGTV